MLKLGRCWRWKSPSSHLKLNKSTMASLPWLPFPYSPHFPRFSGACVLACAFKVMLHGTGRIATTTTALVCWNNIVTFRNNLVAAMLPRFIAQKIVVAKSSPVTSPLVLHEWWSKVIYSIQLLYMSIVALKVPLVPHGSKHRGSVRLQNSPYFCVFKYARAVKQKVWNEAENRVRDWGETLRACEARALRARKTLTPHFTDFFTDFEKKTDCFAV